MEQGCDIAASGIGSEALPDVGEPDAEGIVAPVSSADDVAALDRVEREKVVQRVAQGDEAASLQQRLVRKDGWTEERRAEFLRILGETCNVTEAVKSVGMTLSSVYDLRRRDPAFEALWQQKLEQAYSILECMLVNRGLEGETRTVTLCEGSGETATIKTTRTTKSFSSAVGLRLLTVHRDAVIRYRVEKGIGAPADPERTSDRLIAELAEARVRLKAEGAPPDAGAAAPQDRQMRRAVAAVERQEARRLAKAGAGKPKAGA